MGPGQYYCKHLSSQNIQDNERIHLFNADMLPHGDSMYEERINSHSAAPNYALTKQWLAPRTGLLQGCGWAVLTSTLFTSLE